MSDTTKTSIRSALYGVIFVAALLPIIILLPWLGSRAHTLMLHSALELQAEEISNISAGIEQELDGLFLLLNSKSDELDRKLKAQDSGDGSTKQDNMLDELKSLVVLSPALHSTTIIDRNGVMVAHTDRPGTIDSQDSDAGGPFYDREHDFADPESNPEYTISMHGRNFFGPPFQQDGHSLFLLSVPIGDRSAPSGVLRATVEMGGLWGGRKQEIEDRGALVYLVDSRGGLLSSTHIVEKSEGDLLTDLGIVRKLIAGKPWDNTTPYHGLSGSEVFGAIAPFKHIGGGVVSEVPVELITGPIIDAIIPVAAVAMGTFLVCAAFGVWMIGRVLRPIGSLAEAIEGVAAGDYSTTVPHSSINEIDTLVSGFNAMVAEINQRESAVLHMAHHDSLTGLPNRALLLDRLGQALARAERQESLVAVLFFDLDHFKLINDNLGHAVGDEVLKEAAERLSRATRKADTIARHGGDEFTIVAQDITSHDDIAKIAEKIFNAFKDPFQLGGTRFFVTISMGISTYPNDGANPDTLIKHADIALYSTKEEGRNSYRFYSPSMNDGIARRLGLQHRMRRALENDEFVLHFQPKVDIISGEIIGMEALARWEDPESGLVMPSNFIPLAEETGLIVPIGELVLQKAAAQNKAWQMMGLKPTTIAVNISIRQFRERDFVATVEKVLAETNLEPRYLELELTESAVMDDVESTVEVLKRLKRMGIRLSIDDFGTGYSSLAHLKRMPIDMLKIDRSFVRDITFDPDDVAIIKAIVQMAENLQIDVIAEGVETMEQLELLTTLDCQNAQGFLFAQPGTVADVEPMLGQGWRYELKYAAGTDIVTSTPKPHSV